MTAFKMRRFENEEDFWKIRSFLRRVFILNKRLERSWSVPRLDYWRWHFINTVETSPMEEVTFLWETPDGELAAVLNAIDKGEAFVHIHPDFRSFELENEIYAQVEDQIFTVRDGQKWLVTTADEDDPLRREVLKSRGYIQRDHYINRCRRDLTQPLPEAVLKPGYKVRSMGDQGEYAARALASWRSFHPGEPDEGAGSGDWYANLQYAPLYRRELDMVAEAPNGEIAAFATIWYDDAARSAVCVQVGTAPEYQRLGLGKAVILEGLHRLKKMGALVVFANGFDEPASALYRSALGPGYKAESWLKTYN